MASSDEAQVGDIVNVPGGMYGTVKFVGVVAGKPGRFAGVELAPEHAGRGKNNGDVEGRHYFNTSVPGSGIFVPMNGKYVTKRLSGTPQTPARPVTNFSRSVGPGVANPTASLNRPKFRRPSLPRPESPRAPVATSPPKLSLGGLRTPSGFSKLTPGNGGPRTPHRAMRPSSRPPSRISVESNTPSVVKRGELVRTPAFDDQELMERVKYLEHQLQERDRQLEDQATTLAEFQKSITELEGLDALQVRAQLREKNDRIAALTAEFDSHRADFRSTLDTLEVAASETERVYEKRIEELMQANRELQSRGEDVETVARQLKQLEELVSELEEGLEDARRGEAEARGEVEFLRGEVERTRLELKQEKEKSAAVFKDAGGSPDGVHRPLSREIDQKDDEIRGLKAIIHSLSRGEPTHHALHQQNRMSQGSNKTTDHDDGLTSQLETRIQELETHSERKSYRIEELERELERQRANGHQTSRNRSGTITTNPLKIQKNQKSGGNAVATSVPNHSHTLSDRTVVPNDWRDSPTTSNSPYFSPIHANDPHRLPTMQESDNHSSSTDEESAGWCEICETSGHDILTCTSMFSSGNAGTKSEEAANDQPSQSADDHPISSDDATPGSSHKNSGSPSSQRTGRDVVLEGLKGIGGLPPSSMTPIAGKASGVIDETKWCALCGWTTSPSSYFTLRTAPQALHFCFSASAANSSTTALTWVPRSVQRKRFSQTISPQPLQYHRMQSVASSGLGISSTMPTVSANRTGQWGLYISPSPSPGDNPESVVECRDALQLTGYLINHAKDKPQKLLLVLRLPSTFPPTAHSFTRTRQRELDKAMATSQPPVRFTTHKHLAHRLVLSTLTGRAVHISQIRSSSPTNPGLAPYEISFLRLLEAVTNGSHMEISYTGSILVYKPGLITGSAPGSAPFNILFTGPGVITSSTPTGDMSVDSVRTAILPLYSQFGIFNNIELRVLRRSNPDRNGRGGGGEVQLVFGHQVRLPKTLHLLNPGRIKNIRGVAYSTGVSGSNNARMIEVARGILNPLVSDVYVFSDVSSAALVPTADKNNPNAKRKIGIGFGLSLVAQSSTGCLYSADVASPPSGGQPPEDIGKQCAYQLLETISNGGCVSLAGAPTVLTLMAMGSEDVGRLQVGRDIISHESTVQLARDLSKFGTAGWGVRDASDEGDSGDVVISVVGRGIGNSSSVTTQQTNPQDGDSHISFAFPRQPLDCLKRNNGGINGSKRRLRQRQGSTRHSVGQCTNIFVAQHLHAAGIEITCICIQNAGQAVSHTPSLEAEAHLPIEAHISSMAFQNQ
ncbi:3-hydroxyanthranilate 3,4-dioxygenase [Uncinocarpus reesii 1704]|uniref:3-hydroxyanthranilate 3,4-dioxygenase n=1 Tax=Uncinocarpus reesii (strain UAMH 1704) TaxID=336963 RepID=C4JIJ1_UNCRE|nr:3-hydroxyanthranilate 3,4-dioxygenase [Uncinocarpus reesii 1704]EEP76679.1 3-hydroxyanthranilate 3,4-dioxygenase [Uncinocarpus reesii 1704]